MKKYSWKAKSDDGAFEDNGGWFSTHKEAYNDMRNHALEKMKWNTEWEDFEIGDYDEKGMEDDFFAYDVQISRNQIVHTSYSGTYTYRIVSIREKVYLHGREWEVIDSFDIHENDWKVGVFDGVGTMWMNNMDGYMVLIETSGRILKRDI